MDFVFIVKLLIIIAVCIYSGGFVFDVACDLRMRKLHQRKMEAIRSARQLGKSMAVVHAKIFKIEMDYSAVVELIEKKRRYMRTILGYRNRSYLSK